MELALRVTVDGQQAKPELNEIDRAIVRTSKSAKELGEATDAAMKRLDKGFAAAEKSAADLEREVSKLGQTTERKANPAIGGLNSTLLKYASGAVVMAAIKATADYADRLEELSVQTGIGINALSKFDSAAKTNGASLERLGQAASTFQDRLVGGDRSVVRGLERLGLKLEDIRRMNPEQQFLAIARGVAALEDANVRNNVATDLFGGAGKRLIPTLIEIANNYDKLPGMTDDVAKSTGKLSDAYVSLKGVGVNILSTFLAPFADALGYLAGKMREVNASKINWAQVLPGGWGMPLQGLQNAYGSYNKWAAEDPTIGASSGWANLVSGGGANKDSAGPPVSALFGTDQFGGYASAIESQINEQLRDQARLHRERADAAEAASKKAAKAAADELAAWNAVLAVNRAQVDQARAPVGEDFNLFFGRQFDARGGVVQGQSYFGQTEQAPLASRDIGGVMGPISGPRSAGNIASGFARPGGGGGVGVNTLLDYASYYGNGNVGGQLADIYRGSLQTQAQLGKYGVGSQMMTGSTANRLAAGATAGIGIAEGAMDVWASTDKAGAGERALGGAMAGAKAGAMFGPWGMAIGAAAGLVVGLVRGKPAWAKAADEVGRDFGVKISDALGKEIAKTSKELFKGDRSTAAQFHLGDIIKEAGGLNSENITKMTGKLRDTFSFLERGQFDKEQATKVLDENFGAYADYFDRIGGLADRKFGEIIELQRRFGVESVAIAEYVGKQTQTAVTGLTTFFEHSTATSAEAATGLMGAAVVLFDELKKGPEGIKGALAQMEPIVAKLDEALKATGVEASSTFNDMRSLLGTMANEDVAHAVEAVDGLGKTLVGMSNAVLLNEDTYRGLARAIADTRNNLVAQGHDGEHVNRLMQKDLQIVWELQQDWEYKVDDTTQALLDQAEAQGIVGDKFRSAESQMVRALDGIAGTLGEIRDLLRDDLPAAAETAADGVNAALDRIPSERNFTLNYNYNDPGAPDYAGAYVAAGGYVGAHGVQYLASGGRVLGFRPRGSDTVPAMLTPGEGILSRRGMQALSELNRGGGSLGSGDVYHITVNGSDDPEAVADAILRKVANKRKLSRGRRAA
jgi:hypothetical protein